MITPIILLCLFLILGIKIIFTIKESWQINSTPSPNKEKQISTNPQSISNMQELNTNKEESISNISEQNNSSKQEEIISNAEQNNTKEQADLEHPLEEAIPNISELNNTKEQADLEHPLEEKAKNIVKIDETTQSKAQNSPKKRTARKKTTSPKETKDKTEKKNIKLCEKILSSIIMMHYEEAFTLLSQVDHPSSAVCMSIGKLYYKGEGVTQDYHKAIEWFEKAVELGDVNAEMELGDLYYFKNKFIAQDYEKAFLLYEKAAQKNYAIAQSRLGEMYRDGKYVERNLQKAIEWFEKSVENGDTRAKYQLQQVKESQ